MFSRAEVTWVILVAWVIGCGLVEGEDVDEEKYAVSELEEALLAAEPVEAAADGRSAVNVIVRVLVAGGTSPADIPVQLSVSGAGNTLEPAEGTTDAIGGFEAVLTSVKAEEKVVTAVVADGQFELTKEVAFLDGSCELKAATELVSFGPVGAGEDQVPGLKTLSATNEGLFACFDVAGHVTVGGEAGFEHVSPSVDEQPFQIESGETVSFNIQYKPEAAGLEHEGVFTVTSPDMEEDLLIDLEGRSVEEAVCSLSVTPVIGNVSEIVASRVAMALIGEDVHLHEPRTTTEPVRRPTMSTARLGGPAASPLLIPPELAPTDR